MILNDSSNDGVHTKHENKLQLFVPNYFDKFRKDFSSNSPSKTKPHRSKHMSNIKVTLVHLRIFLQDYCGLSPHV